ncbi:MAG: AsmA family protein [Candidatus Omnitrophica bacterium]|nr:AsmA family protein [Candidatus Omnitrophota bacterium]
MKKFLFILLALFMLGTIVYYYINNIFLPVKFRHYVEIRAQEILGRPVSIGKLEFEIIKGFVISDIEIQKKDDAFKNVAKIKEISFNVLFAPIFKSKKIIIPTIRIRDAVVFIERIENDKWNFSDLLIRKPAENTKYTFLVRKLSVSNSLINYSDLSQEPAIEELFENINFDIALSLQKKITFIAETDLKHNRSKLSLNGDYDLDLSTLSSRVSINNLDIKNNLKFFNISADPFLNNALLSSADLNAIIKDKTLSLSGRIAFEVIDIYINNHNKISGNLSSTNFYAKWNENNIDLKGIYELSEAKLLFNENSSIAADIVADIANLSFSNKVLSINGAFSGKNTKFTLGNDNSYAGDLSINDGFFFSEGDIFKFEGNLISSNSDIVFLKDNFLKGNIDAKNIKILKTLEGLKLNSNLNIDDARYLYGNNLQANGDLFLNDFNLITKANTMTYVSKVRLNNSDITLNNKFNLKGSIQSDNTKIICSKEQTLLASEFFIEGANLAIDEEKRLLASPSIIIDLKYIPKNGSNLENDLKYTATAEFSNALLTGLPNVEVLRNIFGKITLEPDLVKTDLITFNAADTDIKLYGNLQNFKKPTIDIQASSDKVDIETFTKLFPVIEEKAKLKISGLTSASLGYNGKIKDISPKNISASFDLAQAKIKLKFLPETITDINGKINYLNDVITWEQLKGKYKEAPFSLTGTLENLSRPTVLTGFASDKLNFSTEIRPLREAFRIISLKGSFLRSIYDITGDVHFFTDASPDIDLRGVLTLDLEQIANSLTSLPFIINSPNILSLLNKLSPVGTVALEALYKGKHDDWRSWQLVLKASAPNVSLDKTLFENVILSYEQRDLHVSKFDFNCNLYDGILNFSSTADLTQESIPSKINTSFNNINLSLLKKGLNLKNKLSGKGSLNVNLTCPIKSAKKANGSGSLSIKEGYIWHWNILESITNAILIPEFQKVYFTDASASFIIENEKIFTDNALLVGNTVDLTGIGWIDFSKRINFSITPHFSQAVIMQSNSFKKAPTSLLTQAITVNLTGTLSKPVHKVETSPFKVIEGTTELLKEGIGNILGGFF